MKKLIASALLFIIVASTLPASAAPPRQHGIAEYTFHVHIKLDGSANIEERITNRFTGRFNGVFLNINRRGFGNVENLTVLEYVPATGEYIYFTEVRRAREGDAGVFTTSREDGYFNIQVFAPSLDEYRVFVYRYTLTRAAVRFTDAGQFDRTLIGRGWDVPIESYEVVITFEGADAQPAAHRDGNLIYRLYIAGELRGTTTMGTNDIQFYCGGNVLLPGQSLGVDIRFPYQWVPDARVINRGIEDRPFPWVAAVLITIVAMIAMVFLIIYLKARPHKVDFDERYYEKLPSDNGPALMAYLVRHKQLKIKDVLATLLNMARDGILTIKADDNAPENYVFIRNTGFVRSLRPHEEYLITWLMEGIGNSTSVSIQDIQNAGKNEDDATLFHENFAEWSAIVKSEADELEYFESYWRRSPHGELEYRKWLAFKRYLKNLTDVGQVDITNAHAFWDSFLPYALSLGSAKKLMKKLPDIPKPMEAGDWDASNMLWFGVIGPQMLGVCNGVFAATYTHGQSYVAARDDVGGGGFSASSGGGGSSGGAF